MSKRKAEDAAEADRQLRATLVRMQNRLDRLRAHPLYVCLQTDPSHIYTLSPVSLEVCMCWIVDYVKARPGACVYVCTRKQYVSHDDPIMDPFSYGPLGGCVHWRDRSYDGLLYASVRGTLPTLELRMNGLVHDHHSWDTYTFVYELQLLRLTPPYDPRPYRRALDPHLIPDLANMVADFLAPVEQAAPICAV